MRRILATLAAGGMTVLAVPLLAAGPASAEPTYGGFQAEAWATPVRIELYEPTIPIPVDPGKPELDFNLSFTRTRGQTGQLSSLGSWMWPGDGVGQGFATFGAELGLPEALTADGYPIQVNALQPGGNGNERQEPFPGAVMRAQASDSEARAQAGWSTAGEIGEGNGGGGDAPGGPGGLGDILDNLGGLLDPGQLGTLLDLPLLGGGNSAGLGAGLSQRVAGLATAEDSMPGLPDGLDLLIELGGMSSTSRITLGDEDVTSVARSALGDVSLLGGLIKLEGITTVARAIGTEGDARASSNAEVGAIYLAGQKLAFDDEGAVAGGQKFVFPGLPVEASDALRQLGISITLPTATRQVDGMRGTAASEAVRIEIDTVTVKSLLGLLPLADVLGLLPPELGELRTLLDTIINLGPKVVIRLGNAAATTETVERFEFDFDNNPIPEVPDPVDSGDTGGGDAGTGDGGVPTEVDLGDFGGAGGDAVGGVPPGALPDNQMVAGPGLPPLTTIPGLLFWGGLVFGGLAGAWLRRMGLLVLGGGAACAHGCETGLPDLRAI
ncbi:choice-of-anchor P family protein [Nocardioides limicola]|uniref:choice-of-anchor P family protein n=1 Tax=Nocardioides limicola TaxID=2803368 RepID=UPI00193B496D|nr:choice-of-anchor P family protein [Nocardioides sp. DJM-14]